MRFYVTNIRFPPWTFSAHRADRLIFLLLILATRASQSTPEPVVSDPAIPGIILPADCYHPLTAVISPLRPLALTAATSLPTADDVLVLLQNFIAVDALHSCLYFIQIERGVMANTELDVVVLSRDALNYYVFEVPVGDGLVHSAESYSVIDILKENTIGVLARFHLELLQLCP